MLRSEGRVEGVGGLPLYWQAWLPTGRPAAVVVLHHGLAEHGGRYPHAVGDLVAAGYGVYALDARGHGRSGGRGAHFGRFSHLVADFDEVVAAVVRPVCAGSVFLLGYSIGGAVALAYAMHCQRPLAGAIVVGSALGRGSGISAVRMGAAALLAVAAPHLPILRMPLMQMTQDPEVKRAYRSDPLVHQRRLDACTVAEVAAAMRRLPAEFHRLTLPLLAIHGAADITANPEGSRGLIDGAASHDKTLKMYEGRRHDVLNEPGHEQVTADIVSWLDAHRFS